MWGAIYILKKKECEGLFIEGSLSLSLSLSLSVLKSNGSLGLFICLNMFRLLHFVFFFTIKSYGTTKNYRHPS